MYNVIFYMCNKLCVYNCEGSLLFSIFKRTLWQNISCINFFVFIFDILYFTVKVLYFEGTTMMFIVSLFQHFNEYINEYNVPYTKN
jgi:hypothetical protein